MKEAKPLIVVGEFRTLGMKTFWLSLGERLSVSFGFIVLAIAATIAMRVDSIPEELKPAIALAGVVLYGLFFISLIIGSIISWLLYINHTFALDTDAFKIRSGILTKIETAFPYRQIQNVEIERRLLFQMLGLSKIMIITAGHDNPKTMRNEAEGVLAMVEKEIATALQEELLRRSDVQRTIKTS